MTTITARRQSTHGKPHRGRRQGMTTASATHPGQLRAVVAIVEAAAVLAPGTTRTILQHRLPLHPTMADITMHRTQIHTTHPPVAAVTRLPPILILAILEALPGEATTNILGREEIIPGRDLARRHPLQQVAVATETEGVK